MISDAVGGAALLLRGLRFLAQRPKLFWLGAVPPFITSDAALVLLAVTGSGVLLVSVAVFRIVPTLPCTCW